MTTNQTPLNPDALARHQWAHDFNSCDCGKSIPTIIDSENCVYVPNDKAMAKHQIEMATVAQPESNPDTREQRIALGRLLKKALRQCGISMTYALSGPGELYDVAGILLREYPTLAAAQPVVRGYIIVDKKSNAIDWDGELHPSIESAIESMTGPHQSMCRTAEEEDDAANDGRTAWWRIYSIHTVTDRPAVNNA